MRAHFGARGERDVLQAAERADAHAVAEHDGAFEHHVDVDLDVARRPARRRGCRRAPDRRSARPARTARARRAAGRRVRVARVARGRWRLRFRADRRTTHDFGGAEFRRGHREDVGEVVLALRVVVGQRVRASACSAVRFGRDHAGVDQADLALRRRRRPCVRRWRRRGLRRRAGCGRSRSDPASSAASTARRPGASSRRRSVCGVISGTSPYSTSTLRAVGHVRHRLLHRVPVPSCCACSAQLQVGLVGERGLHLVAAMAVHDVDACGRQRARGGDHVRQHRLARRSAAAPSAARNACACLRRRRG